MSTQALHCQVSVEKTAVSFPKEPRYAPAMYSLPMNQPVVVLEAKTAFEGLNDYERFYAHHLSRAAYYGGLIVLLQASMESPQIYRLLQLINNGESIDNLKKSVVTSDGVGGVTVEDFQAFLVYASGIFTNMGNYKGFGDSKFIPDLTVEKFDTIVKASFAYKKDPESVGGIWDSVKGPMYALSDKEKQLGLGDKGVTKYLSANCVQADADRVNRYFKANKIEGYLNRVIRSKGKAGEKTLYEIRNAGIKSGVISDKTLFEDCEFVVTSGDYGKLLARVNEELELAEKFASNEHEKSMIQCYRESFEKGSLDAHKDGSRHWIKNRGPVIETYIGFIETYRDPVGMRAEFEGFVAMVNKEQSAKFHHLVEKAEVLLPRLPWPRNFEKDIFLRPDFTSLDVLAFAGSGIPAGINIPNYDEIRQSEGFKNVSLGNVIVSAYKSDEKTSFVSQEDHDLLEKFRVKSFEVQVGLHELLGHGSGKLLMKLSDGKFNFDTNTTINPLVGKPVDKWYEPGETYDSKFTAMASSYEECRAECVGLYLSCDKEALEIFGYVNPDVQADVVYANWFSLCHAALKGLEMYSPTSFEWKQAHSQARFVILRVLLEAGEGFVSVKAVTGSDGKPDLLLSMDRTKIESVGRPAIGEFLQRLQIYKSTADISSAVEMYLDKYSAVTNDDEKTPWNTWRDIILARKQPRKMFVQPNTFVDGETIKLVNYEASHEGIMKSWRERFSQEEHKEIDDILKNLYEKDKADFTC